MEYSASAMKYSLWFVETRETARMFQERSAEDVRNTVIEENIYQQKDRSRTINEYGCIIKRLEAIPEKLKTLLLQTDVATAKLIVLISAMASDRLLFEFMHDVYRIKLHLGEEELKDSAGLIRREGTRKKIITKPYIDPELRQILLQESMAGYLYALTGEQ